MMIMTSRQATRSPRLAQISLPWQRGWPHNILYGSIESAIPENPLVDANICGLCVIQAELQPILAQISLPWQQGSAAQHFAWFHCIGNPRKPPGRCKHLRSICHTSRLIGNFSPNFVAMATSVGPTTFCMVPLNQPSPKTLWQVQTSAVYVQYKSSYSRFQPKFRCHGNKGRPHILHGSIESAIPENPLVGTNICGLPAIQATIQNVTDDR